MKKTLLTTLVCTAAVTTAGAQKFSSDEKPWRGQAEVQIHPSTLLSINDIAYYKAAHSVYIGAGGGLAARLSGMQHSGTAVRQTEV